MKLTCRVKSWPIRGSFIISRGAKTEARVVVAMVEANGAIGRGECVPYPRYGETPEATLAAIAGLTDVAAAGSLDRLALQDLLPPSAARNAVDCALWDLEAKRSGQPVHQLAGRSPPVPVTTCYTISLGDPAAMAAAAAAVPGFPLLKLKLGGAGDIERMAAVRAARPEARLVADANEAWTDDLLEPLLAAAAAHGLETIEQPLPDGRDDRLASILHPLPVTADEAAHAADSVDRLVGRYDAINIKLDKTGGLTGALVLADRARELGLDIMVGCMVATSLAMAPALQIAGMARWVDLDGPLLLARDRQPGLSYDGAKLYPAERVLWG